MNVTQTTHSKVTGPGSRDPELATLADLRRELVGCKADLRVAKDELGRARRRIEREMHRRGFDGKPTKEEKASQIDWACDDDESYQAGLMSVRDLERKVDKLEALIEIVLAPIRKEQWLVRNKLADALSEYAMRPCMGVREHALVDTTFDATDEDGVHAGDSRFVQGSRFN